MNRKKIVYSLLITLILLLALYARWPGFYMDTKYRDIFFTFQEGKRIAAGENPYERLLQSDMIHNQKYPTYLPPMYLFSALMVKAGLGEFKDFLVFWRILILIFDIALGIFIYAINAREKPLTGIFTAFVWFFSRWTLYPWEIANTESVVLFFMVLSLYYWKKRPIAASLLFGAALGIKHFGILFLPILLAQSRDIKEAAKRLGLILAIPLATSLPFFAWSPVGFSKGIFFNIVREAGYHLLEDSKSLIILFGGHGILLRFFLFIAYILFWMVAIREKWNLWLAAGVSFLLFLSFNPVLFTQYFIWPLPFCLVYLRELKTGENPD
ncbi:DUF2029 domain-containing protein [Candidatus Sumerlaeota bacterium]|nr:DUF2029 domain-containing protein [Candidatus Sumerlaeota bacterium]